MPAINIDKDTFQHALKKLTNQEILSTFGEEILYIKPNQSKETTITQLMEILEEGKITEEIYTNIREKAFSTSKEFYDGFFFKLDIVEGLMECNKFICTLQAKADSTNQDRRIRINNLQTINNCIIFTFEQSNKSAYYDYENKISRTYKQIINADVKIWVNKKLVYIHSKNLMEADKIKTFLNKVLVTLYENTDNKKKRMLVEPKLSLNLAEKWYVENEKNILFKVEGSSLHMLDLLFMFRLGQYAFKNACVRAIYLKEDIITPNTDEAKITDIRFGGEYLEEHINIIEEIKNGKRILGFKMDVDYIYEDDETGQDMLANLPLTILYEEKKYLRLSIGSESTSVYKSDVLWQANETAKEIFMSKFISERIFNTQSLIDYLRNTEEVKQTSKNMDTEERGDESKGSWSF